VTRTLLTLALVLIPVLASAQTPVVGTERVIWDQPGASLAAVQGYTYHSIDGASAATILPGVTCSGTVSPFLCGARLPALTTGGHSLAITATVTLNGQVLSSAPSVPLSLLIIAVPAVPQNVRIG